jgi:hypothetical protein
MTCLMSPEVSHNHLFAHSSGVASVSWSKC